MLGGTASKADGKPTGPVAMKGVGSGTQRSAAGWGAVGCIRGRGGCPEGVPAPQVVTGGEDGRLVLTDWAADQVPGPLSPPLPLTP